MAPSERMPIVRLCFLPVFGVATTRRQATPATSHTRPAAHERVSAVASRVEAAKRASLARASKRAEGELGCGGCPALIGHLSLPLVQFDAHLLCRTWAQHTHLCLMYSCSRHLFVLHLTIAGTGVQFPAGVRSTSHHLERISSWPFHVLRPPMEALPACRPMSQALFLTLFVNLSRRVSLQSSSSVQRQRPHSHRRSRHDYQCLFSYPT